MYRYFKRVAGLGSGKHIYSCKSKGFSNENITPPTTTGYILTPKLSYFGTKTRVEFNANCLRQDKITYNHRKILNIYIVFEISKKKLYKQLSNTRKLFIWCIYSKRKMLIL